MMTLNRLLTGLLLLLALGCTKNTNVVFQCDEGGEPPPSFTADNGDIVFDCPQACPADGCPMGQVALTDQRGNCGCYVCDVSDICALQPQPDAEIQPESRNDAGVEPDTTHVRKDAGTPAPTPDMEPEPQPDAAPLPECEDDVDCDDGKLCESGACTECTVDDQCDGDNFYCNTALDPNRCVQCLTDEDCGACEGDICVEEQGVYVCTQHETLEVCDGLDNDCNGESDETFGNLGTTCNNEQLGACYRTGTHECTDDMHDTECSAPLVLPTLEVCDGVDNNCDGVTDEDMGMINCGVGACYREVAACVDGEPQTCVMGSSSPETCNLVDDNCNGSVDDGLGTTTCGYGPCEHTVDNCVGGMAQTCDWFESAVPETCNNVDDDCNNNVDDGLGTTTCGVGNCVNTGDNCVGGVVQICDPTYGVSLETCDNTDEDCDGLTDEELATDPATCGFGECQRDGVFACEGGTYHKVCTEGTPAVSNETDVTFRCNNLDDDCNGEVDEDFVPASCDGSDGDNCATGTTSCEDGVESCSDNAATSIEDCNNDLDDDCDSNVDALDSDCQCAANECGGDGGSCFCDIGCVGAGDCCENACTACPSTYGVGTACDGSDGDLCADDVRSCSSNGYGVTVCSTGATNPELCNGINDDCNPATPDGSSEAGYGSSCDGTDADLCNEGVRACNGVSLVCNDANDVDTEVCGNTVDEDCSGGPATCPAPTCGDGACNGTETCSSCSADCGTCPAPITTILTGKVINWTPPPLSNGTARSGILYVTACRAGGAPAVLCTAGTAAAPATTIAGCFIPLAEVHCYNESVDVTPYATGPSGLSYSTDGDNWHCNSWAGVQRHDGAYTSSWRWQRPDGTIYTTTAPLPTCQEQSGGGNNNDINPPDSPPAGGGASGGSGGTPTSPSP